ncbi:MAG: thiamine pyrophosphate-binding protein [Planctomycetes bacterium]|nr:thiamine pyrophosphate-binding protein [Planctomycetota bacterium]
MTNKTRGADILIRSLARAGVERLFTLSGNQIMPVFDACIDEAMDLIHVRHEASAVHMADAWGRLTGKPGVALVTAGPGFANALSALYVAFMAESPLLLLSGLSPQCRQGHGAFQEMAQAEMAGHVVKASWTLTDPAQIGHDVARAFRTAVSGRPGPVHLALPVDLLEKEIDRPQRAMPESDEFLPLLNLLDAATAKAMLDTIAAADRPLFLLGPNLTRDHHRELRTVLSEKTGVPAVAMESPRGLHDPSLGRIAAIAQRTDLVLLIGQPLNFMLQFGGPSAFSPDCRFIVIDPEMCCIERAGVVIEDAERIPITALADSIPAIESLVQLADSQQAKFTDWREEVAAAVKDRPAEWESITSATAGCLHPAELCRAVQSFLQDDDDAVLIADGGEFGQWAQACLSAPHRVINGPSGSIGCALPFAVAARCAFPQSRIVTMLGDGTFGFHPAEFDTAVRYNLPFVAVVGNDACWNAERQIQLRSFGEERLIGCDLRPTRYDEVTRALGGHGEFVQRANELPAALERAFDSGLPACVNVTLDGLAAPKNSD